MAQGMMPKDAQKQQKQWKIIISDLVIIRTYLKLFWLWIVQFNVNAIRMTIYYHYQQSKSIVK